MQCEIPLFECELKRANFLLGRCTPPLTEVKVKIAVFPKVDLGRLVPPSCSDGIAVLYFRQHLFGSFGCPNLTVVLIYRLKTVVVGNAHLTEAYSRKFELEWQIGQFLIGCLCSGNLNRASDQQFHVCICLTFFIVNRLDQKISQVFVERELPKHEIEVEVFNLGCGKDIGETFASAFIGESLIVNIAGIIYFSLEQWDFEFAVESEFLEVVLDN